ncbi:MAG: tetratricopeptide repeat protein [Candidatus Erginobacter occultus]|nr:tetratricopeptide repeat protein [Candidatus Erginobacter occultus]
MKANQFRLIFFALGLLGALPLPAAEENSPIFLDPFQRERMPWLEAAEAGNRLWEEGDEAGAVREWEKAVAEGFTDGIAFFYLGRHYLLREDWPKAIRYLRSARPRLEGSGAEEGMILAAREMLALAYLREGEYFESYLHYLQAQRLAPDSPSIHLGLAQLYLLQGKFDQAESSARRVLEISPEIGQAGRILARVAEKRGDYPAAAEYYRIFLADEPQDLNARLARGLILAVHLGRDREAERELGLVIEGDPDRDQAHAVLGEIRLRRGEIEAAEKSAERALKINPENYRALTLLGRLRLQAGDPAEAETLFRKALRVEPEGALALYGLGVVYFESRDYEKAEVHFRRALGRVETFPEAALNRGLALEALGRREEALEVLGKLVGDYPDFAPGQLGWGRVYYYSGDIDRALPLFRNALALDPSAWEPYFFIGKCLWEAGAKAESREYFRAARARGGEAPALLTDLARVYENSGEFDRAEAVLEQALAADAAYMPALFGLGRLRALRNQTTEAERLYRQALVIRPGEAVWEYAGEEREFLLRLISGVEDHLSGGLDYQSLLVLIRNLSREREILTGLIPDLREKVASHPLRPEYSHLLGLAYEEKGEAENAERYFRGALRIDPDFTAAHLSLGRLYTRLGRTAEARRHLSAVLLLAPDSSVDPEVRELLKDLPQ